MSIYGPENISLLKLLNRKSDKPIQYMNSESQSDDSEIFNKVIRNYPEVHNELTSHTYFFKFKSYDNNLYKLLLSMSISNNKTNNLIDNFRYIIKETIKKKIRVVDEFSLDYSEEYLSFLITTNFKLDSQTSDFIIKSFKNTIDHNDQRISIIADYSHTSYEKFPQELYDVFFSTYSNMTSDHFYGFLNIIYNVYTVLKSDNIYEEESLNKIYKWVDETFTFEKIKYNFLESLSVLFFTILDPKLLFV